MIRQTIFVAFLALAASPSQAQPAHAGMDAMPGMAAGTAMSANQAEIMKRMELMNHAMSTAPMTGNPDRDFVAMMMPHHQGAIDMARLYLRDGKDPEIRKMATAILTGQQREIAEFKAWQAKHPAKTP